MSLSRYPVKLEQNEINELSELQTFIKSTPLLSYSKNYDFETLRVSIEKEYDDLFFALVKLRHYRTANASLFNEAIDTTVIHAFELANELIVEKKLNISANKALPIITSHIHQIIKTIDEPSEAQREELNKSISNMQKNLMDPIWQRSPIISNLIVGTLVLLALSCLLAVAVASPVLLAIGVSRLVGDLIFGLALPTLMASGGFVIGAAVIYDFTEPKCKANNKITLFGSSAKQFLQPAQEIELCEVKKNI